MMLVELSSVSGRETKVCPSLYSIPTVQSSKNRPKSTFINKK